MNTVSEVTDFDTVLVVLGATATGKSALADALAVRVGAEVVSADSMQIYRGMNIGTAKLSAAERSVPYHGIDLVDAADVFTAALYQRYARSVVADCLSRGKRVVFCGGSGLYLRAALDDLQLDEGLDAEPGDGDRDKDRDKGTVLSSLSQRQEDSSFLSEQPGDDFPIPPADLRATLNAQAEQLGPVAFHQLLASRDPESAALIHPNNTRRVVRAFELLAQGSSYAQVNAGFARYESVYPARFVGLTVERELLYQLIDQRVDAMIAGGLLDEVRGLLDAGLRRALTAGQAIGYKELVAVLDDQAQLTDAVAAIKQATRRYAKRQMTWFKRDKRVEWLDVTDLHRQRIQQELGDQQFGELLLERLSELWPL